MSLQASAKDLEPCQYSTINNTDICMGATGTQLTAYEQHDAGDGVIIRYTTSATNNHIRFFSVSKEEVLIHGFYGKKNAGEISRAIVLRARYY